MSWLFSSGGQSIGASASTSVLSVNIQDWSPLGWTGWISLQSKGLSRVFSSISSCSAFFMVHLSHLYMTMGKAKVNILVAQSCPTLCYPMGCSLPGSTVHADLQARILKWVVISFSRGSFQLTDETWVFCIAGKFFTVWATRKNDSFY